MTTNIADLDTVLCTDETLIAAVRCKILDLQSTFNASAKNGYARYGYHQTACALYWTTDIGYTLAVLAAACRI